MENLIKQRILANKLSTTKVTKASIKLNDEIKTLENIGRDLVEIKGIGPKTIEILAKEGIRTTEQLKVMSEEWVRTKLNHLSAMHVLEFINKEKELWTSELLKTTD